MGIVPDAYLHVTGLVHENCTRCIFPFYSVNTWELYQMHICMLQMIIFLIATVDKEYHFIVLITRNFVFQTSIVSAGVCFFSFLLSALQFEFSLQLMPFKVIWGFRMLQSFEVLFPARLPLQLGCQYLSICGYNTFLQLPHSYTITKYHAKWLYHSHLAFSHVIKIKIIIKIQKWNLN